MKMINNCSFQSYNNRIKILLNIVSNMFVKCFERFIEANERKQSDIFLFSLAFFETIQFHFIKDKDRKVTTNRKELEVKY